MYAVIDTNVLVSTYIMKNLNSPTLKVGEAVLKGRLTLTLAKLTQHLKVNTVIAEFLFHKSVVCYFRLQRYKKFVVT